MQLSISRVRPEMNNNNYHILSIHLYKNFLIILQSSTSSHCYCVCLWCVCVCVCVFEGQEVGVCVCLSSVSPERQVGDCPLVLADCALDEACSFLTVSTAESEVSCDFYAWASDNIACMTSDRVSCGSHMEVLSCVCPTSEMPSLNQHHSEQMME